ncbi:class II glutamine amidotransferase, partial [Methylobacterium sp. D54C]
LMGPGPRRDPVEATARALARLTDLAGPHPFRFTAALAGGRDLYAFRYAANDKANSLYYRASEGGVVVASEPLDRDHGTRTTVAENSVLVARRDAPVEILSLAQFGLTAP